MTQLQQFHQDCFRSLETTRLLLRPFTMADAPAMFAYTSVPENCRYLKWEAHTKLEQAERFLQGVLERYADHTDFIWGIVQKESGRLIGTIRLFDIQVPKGRGEVSYMITPSVQGHGYASEAIREIIEFAFGTLSLTRIQARCVSANIASEKAMKKSGMSFEGLLQKYAWIHGQLCDFKLYACVRDEEAR